MESVTDADVSDLASVLSSAGAVCRPLFGDSEERVLAEMEAEVTAATADSAAAAGEDLPDLSLFYRIDAPEDQLKALCEKLCATSGVAGAYVKPPAYPAAEAAEAVKPKAPVKAPPRMEDEINVMAALADEALPATADFTGQQGYLNAAPGGIDARYAWTLAGGRGLGVRICDVEGGWNFAHEDLRQNQGGVVGINSTDPGWVNHGTAVVGEIGGDLNSFGITGICADAHVRGVSIFGGVGSAGAIRRAANLLRSGDIILIELHRPGPNATGAGQKGYIPMEWWPDDYAAIRYAVNRGIVVVEAAGNGGENLDAAIYDTPSAGFPADWKNPFRRGPRDSGAVLVGAGAPPSGNYGPDRSRLGFSNYGSAVDVQGWGREVVTTGYGDLQGGTNPNLHYTKRFSGTSSASPIVVGALGCVQGILRARRRPLLSPARARDLLRATGSPQQDGPNGPRTQRIGRRPNLRQLILAALRNREWIGVQFTGSVPGNSSRRWFTHSWPAHWHVHWNVVPITPRSGGPQIDWNVEVTRASDRQITYWVTVRNLTPDAANIEARYAVLGW
ncbi:MAG: S8 family serine peptidase [Alphaproteobacteria bacterium]|nr:S8 family serine peptidase [Alphaproteobacteria bacterium]